MKRLLLGLALIAGCASEPLGPRLTSEYALESIGGASVPTVVMTDYDVTVSLVSDVLLFRDDSTFTEVATFRGASGKEQLTQVDSISGTYAVAGNTMVLLLPNAKRATLTIDGNTLVENLGADLAVYRRR